MIAVKRYGQEDHFGLFFFLSLTAHVLFLCTLFFSPSWMRSSVPVLVSPMLVDLVAPPSEKPASPVVSPEPGVKAAVSKRSPPQEVPAVPHIPEKSPVAEKKMMDEQVVPPPPEIKEVKAVSPVPNIPEKTTSVEKKKLEEKPAPSPAKETVKTVPEKTSPPVDVSSRPSEGTDAAVKRPASPQKTKASAGESNRSVVESALAEMARRVEAGRPEQARNVGTGGPSSVAGNPGGSQGGQQGGYAAQRALDLYRSQAAYRVQQNWAYAGQGRGGGGAVVIFYITRDGRVRDLVVQQSSGDRLVDESARRAILKSEPFPVIPDAIREDRVGMGLRFTDEGVDL